MAGLKTGSGAGYALQLAAGAGWSSLGILPLLPQSTLVLTGDDDPIIPVVNGRILAGLTRDARLHVYPGGHLELAVNPGLLVPVIEEFLADSRPARVPAHISGRSSAVRFLDRLLRVPAWVRQVLPWPFGRGDRPR
jgi:hypothetical protein